jgi:hypothetical protein
VVRLGEQWPVLASQLRQALEAEGHAQLAVSVDGLNVVEHCGCGDDFCQSFSTRPKPEAAYGPGHRNIALAPPWPGYLILDVVHDEIAFVEVLYRTALD